MKNYVLYLAISIGFLTNAAFAVDATEVERMVPYYQKADIDVSAYTKVLIAPLGVSATFVLAPPWVSSDERSTQKWALTAEDKKWLKNTYQKAVSAEISQKYEIVDEPGEGVLIVRVELISLMPFARKGEDVQTQGFGIVVAQAQLRDGGNGELLAIYEGPQRVGNQYQQNTRLNSENSLNILFEIWGARLRMYMENYGDQSR